MVSEIRHEARLDRAIMGYEGLLRDENARSLPSGQGRLAVLISEAPSSKSLLPPEVQRRLIYDQAERFIDAQEDAGLHQEVYSVWDTSLGGIMAQIRDPETTDIAFIGHGSISAFILDSDRLFTWVDLAREVREARHLKQGAIASYMCGIFMHEHEVPLGTFGVDDLSNVIAAPGKLISEANPDARVFGPVFRKDTDLRSELRRLNRTHCQPSVVRKARTGFTAAKTALRVKAGRISFPKEI